MISSCLALFFIVGTTVEVWPEEKMPGKVALAPEAEVPQHDGFHRITNVSRPTLTMFSLWHARFLRLAG